MLITCWSSKGGCGTTVVAAVLASLLAADAGPTLLVDLGGDLPAVLGLPEPLVGLVGWTGGTSEVGAQAGLAGLEIEAHGGVRLLPRGAGVVDREMGPPLARALAGRPRVVVDAGVIGGGDAGAGPAIHLGTAAAASLLVLRPCFLALRRAVVAPVRASGVVLVDEPQRVLGPGDIEAALGVPVVAVVPWDAAVARRVDAGLLGSTPPRAMARALRRALPADRLGMVPDRVGRMSA